jgi:hypothetical protein
MRRAALHTRIVIFAAYPFGLNHRRMMHRVPESAARNLMHGVIRANPRVIAPTANPLRSGERDRKTRGRRGGSVHLSNLVLAKPGSAG